MDKSLSSVHSHMRMSTAYAKSVLESEAQRVQWKWRRTEQPLRILACPLCQTAWISEVRFERWTTRSSEFATMAWKFELRNCIQIRLWQAYALMRFRRGFHRWVWVKHAIVFPSLHGQQDAQGRVNLAWQAFLSSFLLSRLLQAFHSRVVVVEFTSAYVTTHEKRSTDAARGTFWTAAGSPWRLRVGWLN